METTQFSGECDNFRAGKRLHLLVKDEEVEHNLLDLLGVLCFRYHALEEVQGILTIFRMDDVLRLDLLLD
jgi:hypothetical protein